VYNRCSIRTAAVELHVHIYAHTLHYCNLKNASTSTALCEHVHVVQQLEEVLLVMRDHLGAARSETVTARASAASASAQHREAIALLESDARTAREWRAKADVALTQFPREREALQAQVSALCCCCYSVYCVKWP
jgi:hypothetical protein